MVSAHGCAGSFVCLKPLLALAAVKVGVAIVRFGRWRAARARMALRRPCLLQPFTSVPRGPHEAAADDGLPVSAPAAGASRRAAAPWAYSLAQARDWRLRVPAALVGQHLERAFSRRGRTAARNRSHTARARLAAAARRELRSLGPGSARGAARFGPHVHRPRISWRRTPTVARPVVAAVLTRGGGADPCVCRALPRRRT